MKKIVLRRNSQFCKEFFKSIKHDKYDCKKHSKGGNQISVSDHSDNFKANPKNPKLPRPEGTIMKALRREII